MRSSCTGSRKRGATQLRDESGDLAALHVREISTQTVSHAHERVVFLPRTLPLLCFAPTFLLASRPLVITLPDSVVLSSLECQKFRIIQHAAFSNWLSVPQHICLSAYRRSCWWLFWFGELVLETSVYRFLFFVLFCGHTLSTHLGKDLGAQLLGCALCRIYYVRCQTVFQHVFIIPRCFFHFRLATLDIICGRTWVLLNV